MAQTSAAQPEVATRRPLITQAVNPAKLRRLTGNTRPEANAQNDQGKVDDSFSMDHMLLQLQRSADQEAAVNAFIDQLHDSSSPNFHKWLTTEEFGARFGIASEDIAKISQWLESNGFTVNTVYPNGMVIDFSGTAGQVNGAFHTEIHKLLVNGKQHVANMSDPQIPEALAPVVAGIASLHDFKPRGMRKPKAQDTVTQSGTTFQIMTPADLATIYDLNAAFSAGYSGQGQTIAVIEDTNLFTSADWTTFRNTLGLSGYSGTLNTVHPAPGSGRNNCSNPGVNSDDQEAVLDVEWASAAAPSAAIVVASCAATSSTDGVSLALENLISESSTPAIISISYGSCEAIAGAAYNATINSAFQTAVAKGVSIFVATGDSGPAACDGDIGSLAAVHGLGVSSMASTPYNVAVGGTDFLDTAQGTSNIYWSGTNSAAYGSALTYIPETPWNGSCAASVVANYYGYQTGYGANGFCGSFDAGYYGYLGLDGGGGGPSNCATGAPTVDFIVGGSCQGYAKPTWQTGLAGIPNDGVRDLPDVSLFASNGVWNHYYVTCYSDTANGGAPCSGTPDNWSGAGGTSYATPIMAGIQALVNQKMGGAQGNPNPVLYKLAASSVAPMVFHSISTGDSSQNCSGTVNCFGSQFEGRGRAATPTPFAGNGALSTTTATYTPAFAATGGWSLATGIGSVDAYNLILNWSKGQ